MNLTNASIAPVDIQPEMTVQFLPRCARCGAPHPRAQKLDQDDCPTCGAPSTAGPVQSVPAVLHGTWAIIPNVFLAIGRFLNRIARSL